MNSSDFQKLTALRLREAKVLMRNGCYAGSYYLAGYAVECALKACIAAKTQAAEFPPKPDIVREYYKHDLSGLVRFAGLGLDLEKHRQSVEEFALNWAAVKDWTEQTRYETKIDKRKASGLLQAIVDSKHGVLKWLKTYW